MPFFRRKNSIVKPRSQIFFALEVLLLCVGFFFTLIFLLLYFVQNPILAQAELADSIRDSFLLVLFQNWHLVVVTMLIFFTVALLIAHRIWGPIYGLEKILADWKQDDTHRRVHFRKSDYLYELDGVINEFLEYQEKQTLAARNLLEELKQAKQAEDWESIQTLIEKYKHD